MNDSFFMRRLQTFRDLCREEECLREWNRTAPNTFGQRLTGDQFHHEEGLSVGLLGAIEHCNVGMTQRSQQACFPLKSTRPLRVIEKRLRQKLDGNTPAKG